MVSPKSTLPNDEKEAQDSHYNPGEQSYREGMGAGYSSAGADQAEAFANDPANHDSADAVRTKEESPDDESLDGGLYKPSSNSKPKRTTLKGALRKKGALAAIISLVFGAGLGFSALLSPSLLIIHMKEIMTDKFNTQLSSLDARQNKLLNTKIDSSTSGLCGSVITLRCKFSTMSEKQVANFKDAKITVEPDTPNAGKRTKPTGYVFKDQKITASDFAKLSKSDPEFKAALRRAYNPKFAGFSGKAWNSLAKFFGVSKQPTNLDGATDEERMKKLNSSAKSGDTNKPLKSAADFENEKCNPECAQTKADKVNGIANEITDEGKSGNAAKKAAGLLEGLPLESIGAATKITGAVDTYCQAFGALNAVGYAAKAVRAVQLVRYMVILANVADEIKSGKGVSSEKASFIGKTLTTVKYDSNRKIVSGSATDSLGYKFAAYGDSSASKRSMNIANRFLTGGGFTGDLVGFTNAIESYFPGGRQGARQTCGVLANPVVQGGSLILGVAALFIPGVNVAGELIKVGAIAAVGYGISLLPALLSDIIAGTVTDNISGEASGNAYAAGAGKLMSDSLAGFNGNALMTKSDTLAYNNLQDQTLAAYARDDRATLSPLDPTSENTFLGSIVSKLLPTTSSISNGASLLASFGSILSTSLGSIIPKTSAITTAQYTEALSVCQDPDAKDAGYATDPFCNVIRGLPPKYLNKDPILVVDQLITSGDLVPSTEAPTAQYSDFISQCIENTDSPGYGSADVVGFDVTRAKSCIINDENANKFLNYLDQRVEGGMSGDDEATKTTDTTTTSAADATIDQAHIYDPSTSIACAAGTTDAGVAQGYRNGVEIDIRICSIPNTVDTSAGKNNLPIRVNSRISGATLGLTKALAASPANGGRPVLRVADSFRTMANQQEALALYGLGRAAKPGYSSHQMGLAIDFQLGSNDGVRRPGDPVYDWLVANAKAYGFAKLSSESWHWQAQAAQGSSPS